MILADLVGAALWCGQVIFLVIILYGHLALWIGLFNRTHAMNIPCRWIRPTELFYVASAVGLLVFLTLRLTSDWTFSIKAWQVLQHSRWLFSYGIVCLVIAAWTTAKWLQRNLHQYQLTHVLSNNTEHFDIAKKLHQLPARGWSTRLFAYLPMNQMFDLCVNVKTLHVPRLPRELDGLTITHLSDLHFTGKITRPFFDLVFEQARSLNGDLIAITGDILESEPCYEWLAPTLGKLRAPLGIFFVLGNHDKRLKDVGQLRRSLTDLGLVDLGTSIARVRTRGRNLLFAGNEMPWFPSPVEVPSQGSDEDVRILLSHSPDQIEWAKQKGFDLMLAGHNHGGHIRLPGIGPIVCPSRYGVKYASGVFWESPTLLHVSRGISGLDPLRFNCPPELTKLVLRSEIRP